jgi:type VI secretion system protein ImpD
MLRHMLMELDERLSLQLSAIVAHAELQRLERSWREMHLLVTSVAGSLAEGRRAGNVRARVVVRVLDLTARELLQDIQGAMSRRKTQIFRHLYGKGIDFPAGQPVGLIVVGFEFGGEDLGSAGLDDVAAREFAEYFAWLGNECLAPVAMGISPAFLSFESFDELAHVVPERLCHPRLARATWLDRMRRSDESRFLVFTMPRVLLRGPHRPSQDVDCGFGFRHARWRSANERLGAAAPVRGESVDDRHLFGSAAFPLAAVIARSFAFSSWFTYVRGVECGDDWSADGGGVFVPPACEEFATDASTTAVKPSVDAVYSERTEERLGTLGLAVLSGSPTRGWTVFHSIPSFRDITAIAAGRDVISERLGSMVQYLLCACRVAHLVHRYSQTLIGSAFTARQIEEHLQAWLSEYQVDNPDTGSALLLKRPLRGVRAAVRSDPENVGKMLVDIWLQPHSQFSGSTANLHLVASVNDASRRGGGGRA